MNMLTDQSWLKLLTGLVPVVTFALQTFGYLLNWLKDGSLHKLKKLDKDYKVYLGQEEKKLVKETY